MTKKVITQKIADRLRQATEHASEFKETYHKTVPFLEEKVEESQALYQAMKQLTDQARNMYQNLAVAHGYMLEGEQIAAEHWNNVAQVATLAFNFDIFFQGDPELMAHVFNTIDPPVLETALRKVPAERLVTIQQAIQRTIDKHKEQ